MSDPDQEEMRRKRLARLSSLGGGGEKEKTSPAAAPPPPVPALSPPALKSPANEKPAPSQKMEVDSQSSSLKGGASQVSLDFDSGIENMELEEGMGAEGTSTISPTKRNRTSSSANYEVTPGQALSKQYSTLLFLELRVPQPQVPILVQELLP